MKLTYDKTNKLLNLSFGFKYNPNFKYETITTEDASTILTFNEVEGIVNIESINISHKLNEVLLVKSEFSMDDGSFKIGECETEEIDLSKITKSQQFSLKLFSENSNLKGIWIKPINDSKITLDYIYSSIW